MLHLDGAKRLVPDALGVLASAASTCGERGVAAASVRRVGGRRAPGPARTRSDAFRPVDLQREVKRGAGIEAGAAAAGQPFAKESRRPGRACGCGRRNRRGRRYRRTRPRWRARSRRGPLNSCCSGSARQIAPVVSSRSVVTKRRSPGTRRAQAPFDVAVHAEAARRRSSVFVSVSTASFTGSSGATKTASSCSRPAVAC